MAMNLSEGRAIEGSVAGAAPDYYRPLAAAPYAFEVGVGGQRVRYEAPTLAALMALYSTMNPTCPIETERSSSSGRIGNKESYSVIDWGMPRHNQDADASASSVPSGLMSGTFNSAGYFDGEWLERPMKDVSVNFYRPESRTPSSVLPGLCVERVTDTGLTAAPLPVPAPATDPPAESEGDAMVRFFGGK